jgi:hypothetical protein
VCEFVSSRIQTPHAAVHNLNSWRWTYRCPKHVELLVIINHNCCIKLVLLVIFQMFESKFSIHKTRGGWGQTFIWQYLIYWAYLLQFLCIEQRVQVHMYQADSYRHLRFLVHFSIVCTQYGSHFMSRAVTWIWSWPLDFFKICHPCRRQNSFLLYLRIDFF